MITFMKRDAGRTKSARGFHTGDLFSQRPSYKNNQIIYYVILDIINSIKKIKPFLQLMQAQSK
jgi:hypothetical protein